jgi:DNA-binding transcriptional LysR family regulator
MDLRHARTFVAVAELGTVSKAALRLRTAQPALSRQIGALEHELGLKLFDRVGRGLVLSAEGEALLGDFRTLLNQDEALRERAQRLRRGDAGMLKVAASPQFIEGVIADFMHRFAARYPAVKVKLSEAIGWQGISSLLERGEVHLGQSLAHAVRPDAQRFAHHPLGTVELLAACPPRTPLGRNGAIEIGELAAKPLLLLDVGYIFRRTFDAACRLAKVEPHVAFESRTPHTLLAMARSGHGVAVIPSTLQLQGQALRIVSITYRGKPLSEPLAMFWDPRRTLPPYAEAFSRMVADYMREAAPRRGLRRGKNRAAEAVAAE